MNSSLFHWEGSLLSFSRDNNYLANVFGHLGQFIVWVKVWPPNFATGRRCSKWFDGVVPETAQKWRPWVDYGVLVEYMDPAMYVIRQNLRLHKSQWRISVWFRQNTKFWRKFSGRPSLTTTQMSGSVGWGLGEVRLGLHFWTKAVAQKELSGRGAVIVVCCSLSMFLCRDKNQNRGNKISVVTLPQLCPNPVRSPKSRSNYFLKRAWEKGQPIIFVNGEGSEWDYTGIMF